MKVPVAYLCVVLIWSTTPLGIVWSNESVSPTLAVLLRMIIAAVLGTMALLIWRIKLPFSQQAIKLYSYSALGVFGGMMCSYMAARYMSSGMLSLAFGLSPVVSGVLAQKILNEPKFSPLRLAAFLLSMAGLVIVCWDKLTFGSGGMIGIVLSLAAVLFFSLSGVLVKSVKINIHPLATTLGALYFSVPLFIVSWLLFDGHFEPDLWSAKSVVAIIYLGVFGSLIGFITYFFVLQKLAASTVSLITLITPSFAIYLGATFNNEQVSFKLLIGASCIMLGLSLYFWGDKWLAQRKIVQA